jgi:hypothetical protein
MTRKFEIALLAATLAVAAPFSSAFAAPAHHRPAMTPEQASASVTTPRYAFLAANGAAASARADTFARAELAGHGADGGIAN